jgi:hypothetical protein
LLTLKTVADLIVPSENKDGIFGACDPSAGRHNSGILPKQQERNPRSEEQPMSYQPDTPRNRGEQDAPHLTPVTPAEDLRTVLINKVSWGAVLAGVVVALVTQLILNMIGIGVGAATLSPATGDNPSASTFSIGAGIWWTLSGILASLAGGYAAGRLSGVPKESTGGWHGITSWALTTLIIFFLLTSAIGGIVGGTYRAMTDALGSTASTAGSVAQTAAQAAAPSLARTNDPFTAIEQTIKGRVSGDDAVVLRDAAVSSVRALVTGDQQQASEARERAADALARAQKIPIEQARTQVQQYEQQYRQAADQAKQQAKQAADTAAKAASRGAFLGAIALILGAIAAWFGGRFGTIDPTVTGNLRNFGRPSETVTHH